MKGALESGWNPVGLRRSVSRLRQSWANFCPPTVCHHHLLDPGEQLGRRLGEAWCCLLSTAPRAGGGDRPLQGWGDPEVSGCPEGKEGPGNKGAEGTENKAAAVELGQEIVERRMAAPRRRAPKDPLSVGPPGAEPQSGRKHSQRHSCRCGHLSLPRLPSL